MRKSHTYSIINSNSHAKTQMYYTYAYLRKKDRTPYYIGKGQKRRMFAEHWRGNGSFSGRSKEVATICFSSKMLYGRKEVALNRVVCLIKVDGVNLNVGTLKLLQRVIGGEDQFVTRSVLGKPVNIRRFGRRIVMSLTCMNVHHSCIGDKLKILTGELLCQKNTRSNNYNGLRSLRKKLVDCIKDTYVGLTTTRRKHTDAFRMLLKSIQSILLVGTKLNHVPWLRI